MGALACLYMSEMYQCNTCFFLLFFPPSALQARRGSQSSNLDSRAPLRSWQQCLCAILMLVLATKILFNALIALIALQQACPFLSLTEWLSGGMLFQLPPQHAVMYNHGYMPTSGMVSTTTELSLVNLARATWEPPWQDKHHHHHPKQAQKPQLHPEGNRTLDGYSASDGKWSHPRGPSWGSTTLTESF